MLWLSTFNISNELEGITRDTRPWALLRKFWQFSNTYGDYHSLPPSKRRRFIIDYEQRDAQGHF